jgi:hypothetical protein
MASGAEVIEGLSITLVPDLEKQVTAMVAKTDTPMEMAEKVAAVARSTAPVLTGKYQSSIKAEKTKYGARVISKSPEASKVEFGAPNIGIQPRYIFRRAAESLGMKFWKKK